MSRKEIDQHLFALQYELIFTVRQQQQQQCDVARRRLLRVAASFIERAHYDAVVEERSVNDLCGYPLCTAALPPRALRSSAKYRVAPRQGKVYASAAQHFCSEACAIASAYYAKQLSAVGVYVRELAQPLRVRLLDDPPEPADAWLSRRTGVESAVCSHSIATHACKQSTGIALVCRNPLLRLLRLRRCCRCCA
jgi:hypothetical protein